MMKVETGNIYEGIPSLLPEEWFETLCSNGAVRIERIVSRGHRSADDFWFDQAWDEWVMLLQGEAELQFAGAADVTVMTAGDWLLIPAGVKHRVDWTTADEDTVWLAVHLMPSAGGGSPAGARCKTGARTSTAGA